MTDSHCPAARRADFRLALRGLGCALLLALLAACANQPQGNQIQEAEQYQSRASHTYPIPGPPEDPWGPYVEEASKRFDVPQPWIRNIMRVESNGQLYQHGQLTTSWCGAMGLMQVMPETYDGLRARHNLGDDAYDPHNNVLAGTAYIREMYDLYGSPGFAAAYNAGPRRLDDYLNNVRGLPDETRHYVAKVAPYIAGIYPEQRSPVDELAFNQIPNEIPSGLRYPKPVTHLFAFGHKEKESREYAKDAGRESGKPAHRGDTQVAQASRSGTRSASHGGSPEQPRVQTAMATTQPHGGGLHLISPAEADTLPTRHGGPANGKWAVQVGAFGNQGQARSAADAARGGTKEAHAEVGTVHQPKGTMYRARLTGMSRDAAVQACEKMKKGSCLVLSPASQS